MNYRARIDKGKELEPEIEKMFWDNLGQTPMCCIKQYAKLEDLKEGEPKEWLQKCDMVEKPLSEKDFEKFCLVCQTRIAQKLVIMELNKKETLGDCLEARELMRKISKTTDLMVRTVRMLTEP